MEKQFLPSASYGAARQSAMNSLGQNATIEGAVQHLEATGIFEDTPQGHARAVQVEKEGKKKE